MWRTTTALLITGAAVLFAAGVVGSMGAVTASCSICHSSERDAWARSTHAPIGCQQCHQRPGVLGLVEQRTRMVGMIGAALAGREAVSAEVHDSQCLGCHASINSGTVARGGIAVRHSDFLASGWSCGRCHGTVVHKQAAAAGRVVTMDTCLSCHDGASAAAECRVCHTDGVAPGGSPHRRVSRGPARASWQRTHLTGDPMRCKSCHGTKFCKTCHGIELPHPDSILDTHGRLARANTAVCTSCHDSGLCTSCHKVPMPHPDGFLRDHDVIAARSDGATCRPCHMQRGCDECHARHLHPGLTPGRVRSLGQGG